MIARLAVWMVLGAGQGYYIFAPIYDMSHMVVIVAIILII
jgi:hypothetical protein